MTRAGAALVGAALGTAAALLVLPAWVPLLAGTFRGATPPAYWQLSRASGVVAFLMLWLSVVLGLLVTNRWARRWPGAARTVELHELSSLVALGFATLHALLLLGDRFLPFSLGAALLPFAAPGRRWLAIALGQIGVYLLAMVLGSFYVRRAIGPRLWRAFHFTSFAVFALALAHGIAAGTDGGALRPLYWMAAGSVLFLTIYRVVAHITATQ